jgi:hypothetical protein
MLGYALRLYLISVFPRAADSAGRWLIPGAFTLAILGALAGAWRLAMRLRRSIGR